MQFSVVFLFATIWGFASCSPPHPCQCWPDWEPIPDGDDYLCKNPKSARTFLCNIDVPPVCHCKEKGEIVDLPLGEINCVGEANNRFDEVNCENTPAWTAWFDKYPQYRIQL